MISTGHLSLEETWEPAVTNLVVGDAVTRTVTVRAEKVVGMGIPGFSHPDLSGVGTYPARPEVSEKVSRGELEQGLRVEKVTYVVLEPGRVEFPAVAQSWWDPEKEVLHREELPVRAMMAAPNPHAPVAADGGTPAAASGSIRWQVSGGIGALLLGVWLWRRGPVWQSRYRGWRRAWSERGPAYFETVLRAARAGDPAATLRALMSWLDRQASGSEVGRLEPFLVCADNPELTRQVRALEDRVCAVNPPPDSSWSSEHFCRALREARTRLHHNQSHRERHRMEELPALNP